MNCLILMPGPEVRQTRIADGVKAIGFGPEAMARSTEVAARPWRYRQQARAGAAARIG